MYIKVKDLHPVLRKALESVNYNKTDIEIKEGDTASLFVGGDRGKKGFAILIDLENNKYETHWGSWGGANMFNPRNAVDLDTNQYQLPTDGAVITGSMGAGVGEAKVYASIVVHPSLIPQMLPESVKLTKDEKDCLYCFRAFKGGAYRREELIRRKVGPDTIDRMTARGFLAKNRAGACQITASGKNAISDYYGY